MNIRLNYLKNVLGIDKVILTKANHPKITLVSYFNEENKHNFEKLKKIKKLLLDYGVLRETFINFEFKKLKRSGLIFSLGCPLELKNSPSGTWVKVGGAQIMWTNSVNEIKDEKIKLKVWNDLKKAIRMCGLDV